MTGFALGLHEELVNSGVDPRSDAYYKQVDDTMRKTFPARFEVEPEEEVETKAEAKPSPRARPWLPAGNNVGSGHKRSKAAKMAWVSQ